VAEAFLDDLRVDAGFKRQRRVGMPQVVQPDLRQPGIAGSPTTSTFSSDIAHAVSRPKNIEGSG
jgi:hypothetical protein